MTDVRQWNIKEQPLFVGKQGQTLRSVLTSEHIIDTPFSILDVSMPAGQHIKPHKHENAFIVVRVLAGRAATLYGPELEHCILHEPGQICYIAPGVIHTAVNLGNETVFAMEIRTDSQGDEDTIVIPELFEKAYTEAEMLRNARMA